MRKTAKSSAQGAPNDERFNLTPREADVIRLLAKGRLYKEIADDLSISVSAVHKHQYHLFKKLDVENRTEAAIKWMEISNQMSVTATL